MKLWSPITILVALAVALLSVSLWVLDPASWGRALLSLVFLPIGGVLIFWLSRRHTDPDKGRKSLIRIRAAIVGGGAVLASALGFRLVEVLGIETGNSGKSLVSVLLVLVVVFGDLLAARMDGEADKIDETADPKDPES